MIHIGTSGYSYEDWKGVFYPQGIKSGDMLAYYSQHFGFTEINSTYYKIPNAFMMYNMQKKTGDDFLFTVKLHQSMTHGRNASKLDYDSFIEAVNVLEQVGKLGCLVGQFPYSFHFNKENMDYILRLKERLIDFKISVEFRNNKWLNEECFQFLKANDIGYICVDEPALYGLPDTSCIATSQVAYLRLHGRNSQKWWNHNESYERYDYLYSEQELLEWKDKIIKLEEEASSCFVSFNNHFRAQAVINARMLGELLNK
jgi:uncharacterized protein YecE (DUF72 family)